MNRRTTKLIFILASIAINLCGVAQNYPFEPYPLKGQIKSVEVVEMQSNAGSTPEQKLETTQYDKKGRPILRQTFESYNRVYTEKNIYTDNLITTFKCYCKDTDELEKNFNPQPNLEPKNSTNYGWASADDGSSRPKIEVQTLDKNGNRIETKYYDQDGSINSIKKMQYSKNNLLLHSELYYYLNELDTEETFTYDASGNCVDHLFHDLDKKSTRRNIKRFDTQNRIIENTNIYNSDTVSYSKYQFTRNGKTEESFVFGNKGELNKLLELQYNDKDKLISQISFRSNQPYEEGTFEYFDSGRLSKESFRNTNNNHIRERYYEDSKSNNCIKLTQQYPSIETRPEGQVTTTQQKVYLRRIIYY